MVIRHLSAAALLLAAAAPPLSEPAVRAFLDRQDALWERGDLAGYYATVSDDAVITTEATGANGRRVRTETTKTEDRRDAERIFATIKDFRNTASIDAIVLAPDGQSAVVRGHERARFVRDGRRKERCARTEQRVALRGGAIMTVGMREESVPCPALPGRFP